MLNIFIHFPLNSINFQFIANVFRTQPLQNIKLKLKLMTHSVKIIFPHTALTWYSGVPCMIQNITSSCVSGLKLSTNEKRSQQLQSSVVFAIICTILIWKTITAKKKQFGATFYAFEKCVAQKLLFYHELLRF